MLFIGLCIAIVVISIIITAKAKSDSLFKAFASLAITSILIIAALLVKITPFKIPYNSDRAKAELQAKHDAIVAALGTNDTNYISFSDDIGAYNAAVLKGRRSMDDIWFRDFDYDFYYDLELIKL